MQVYMKSKIITALIAFNCYSVPAWCQTNAVKAEATIEINEQSGYYELTDISVNGGDESYASRMANSVIESLNKHIETVTGSKYAEIIDSKSNSQIFGHNRDQAYIITSKGKQNAVDGDNAAELGALHGIRNTQIVGGNIYLKRAAIRSTNNNHQRYKLDLLAGGDFEKYLRNKHIIDAAIEAGSKAGAKPSDFARHWQFTLDLNSKNGIEKSSTSDFYGGAKGFIQSILRLHNRNASLEDISFKLNEDDLEVVTNQTQHKSGKVSETVIFTEKNFLNSIGHPNGGTGYTQSKNLDYLHFKGPDLNGISNTNDILIGNEKPDNLTGGKGRDWLDGQKGPDVLNGGAGDDVLLGGSGDDHIKGGDGNDSLYAGGGSDKLYGGSGDDELHSSAKDGNIIGYGGAGDDVFVINGKNHNTTHHKFYGGAGSDTISFRYARKAVVLTLEGSSQTIDQGRIKTDIENIENITGSPYGDTLIGDGRSNKLFGSGGDDTINGKGGDDIVEGGAGADTLIGGNGTDTLSYEQSIGGVDVSLEIDKLHAFGGDASGDSIEDTFENLTGSSSADVLEGNILSNTITGLSGDDYIIASNGADIYSGGRGFDSVDYGNHEGGAGLKLDAVRGIQGYKHSANPSTGTHQLKSIEHIVGTKWDDVIKFGKGNNVLEGGKGADILYGGRGDDTYFVEIDGGHDQIIEYGAEGRDMILIGYQNGLSWNDIFLALNDGMFEVKANDETIVSTKNGPYKGRKFKDLGIEVINLANSGEIEIDILEAEYTGQAPTNIDDTLVGHDNTSNLLQGLDGNDVLIGGATKDSKSDKGNLFNGGRGDDQMFAGDGNDIYLFDVGSGADTITDQGGIDHLYFGPGVKEDSLLFEIKGKDLYLGLKPKGDKNLTDLKASQMVDRIRFVNSKGRPSSGIELYTINNKTIDVRKKN